MDGALASALVVPLIGIPCASERAYSAAAVLATEEAIAERIDTLATRAGPVLAALIVDAAMAAKSFEIGAALSAGQRNAIAASCGSGRSVELIVAVAGAGKTTALHVAGNALEAAGYRVVGTATSGQAVVERPELAKALAHLDRLRQQGAEPPEVSDGFGI